MEPRTSLPFHPLLSDWFAETFGEPTPVQIQAWDSIGKGRHTLIAAPTGSGKTLAALLPCLDRVIRQPSLPNGRGVRIVYITPLKALNNDIHHHALQFVSQLEARAFGLGTDWPGLRSEVRTGDTSPSKRAAILRNPPELLVTTPESLYLMLTSDKGRGILETVEHVIVDEIHDLAADKRGAHLSVSLERLSARCHVPPQRIGVSATQKPLEKVASFLGGWETSKTEPAEMRPRPVDIIESAMNKRMDVRISMPDMSKPAATREAVWLPLLDRIVQAMESCRSVLLFVNSRRLAERLCLRLNDHVGYEMARSHHGSLSRERRLEVERLLKEGSLRAIVATSSLELGIDVGHIDLVIQVDSPQEAARGIQRIGRAGHAVGEASRGLLLARGKAILPELAVLGREIARREIEPIRIPREPMDVLSQQIVSLVAMDDWDVEELLRFLRRSDSYRDFPRERLESMLKVLSGFYPFVRPLVDWNGETNVLSKRSNTAMAAVTGVGTIPQSGNYPVHHLDSRAHLGELDEEFIQESRVGDVFQLGTTSWMIRDIRNDRVYVTEAGNRFSEIPFWRNEAASRSYEAGLKIGEFMRELSVGLGIGEDGKMPEDEPDASTIDRAAEWLIGQYGMDEASSGELIALVLSQSRACGLPTDRQIVIEHYRDVMNQTHVIVHNQCGRTVNRAWLLAIERQFELLLPYRLYGNAKDNGIEFVLPEWDASWLQVLQSVTPANVELLLTEAITGSPLLGIAFRRIAENSLLLSRSFTRTPLWQKRLRSEGLLKGAMPYAEHFPYLREAMSECLHDYLGFDQLRTMLEKLVSGSMTIVMRETPFPSPFAAQFIADYVNMQVYEGDGLDETTRLQLLNVSKELAGQLFDTSAFGDTIGREAIEDERRKLEEPERPPTNAAELAGFLKRRGDLTAGELAKLAGNKALGWLKQLQDQGKVIPLDLSGDGEYRWIPSDERETYSEFPVSPLSVTFVLGRYADHVISFTDKDLCDRYPALSLPEARQAVDGMLDQGLIERAPHAADDKERLWSSSKVASRIVRSSISHARSKAEPIDSARWCSRIAFMQHALQGTQQQGSEGLQSVIEKLQGLFLPLSHWETIIFPSRVSGYRKEQLDLLCASGEVLWIGRKNDEDQEGKVAFFLAGSRALYAPLLTEAADSAERPTRHPELLRLLTEGGASFLTRISRDSDRPPSELIPELLELVWEGRAANDQFAPLRLHANAKPGNLAKTGSGLGRWYATSMLVVDKADRELSKSSDIGDTGKDSPVLSWIHHLLRSYGIMNKELAANCSPFSWDTFYPVLRRLEEWGVVTRGSFIREESSLQFSTRELNETIRQPLPVLSGQTSATVLSSVDPANPFGLLVDWPSFHVQAQDGQRSGKGAGAFARKPGNFLVLMGDRWLFWIENNGKRIYELPDSATAEAIPQDERIAIVQSTLNTILRRRNLVKVKVETWNGVPILETKTGEDLLGRGGEKDLRSLVFWLK